MKRVPSITLLLLQLAFTSSVTRALVIPQRVDVGTSKLAPQPLWPIDAKHPIGISSATRRSATTSKDPTNSRRQFGAVVLGGLVTAVVAPSLLPSYADVSDGNTLPQGAQQFAKSLRLQKDVKVRTAKLWLDGPWPTHTANTNAFCLTGCSKEADDGRIG
jgi:hypothetical protein